MYNYFILGLIFYSINGLGCDIYGTRLSLGYYYTRLENPLDLLKITFNTDDNCEGQFSILIENGDFYSHIPNSEYQFLNMTDLTQEDQIQQIYETHIYSFSIGLLNLNLQETYLNYTYSIIRVDGHIDGPFQFDIPKKYNEEPTRFVLFGDMDSNWGKNTSKPTFDWFEMEQNNNTYYDGLIFLGDMAYDLELNDYQMAEEWLKNISHFTQRYPFMITPGNHDHGGNQRFEYLRANFKTLRISEYDQEYFYNDLYSFDIGYAHFISYNPMWIMYESDTNNFKENLLKLMKSELELATQNRDNVPWIIVFNHYPLYCSDPNDEKCRHAYQRMSDFETLYKEFKVDLFLAGHQHSYERDKPFYQNQIASFNWDGTTLSDYEVPLQLIEGAAGNDYFMPDEPYNELPFTWEQAMGTGVGILNIVNKTHLYFEHRMTINNSIVDQLWMKKSIAFPDKALNKYYYILPIIGVIVILALIIVYLIVKKRNQSKANLLNTIQDD